MNGEIKMPQKKITKTPHQDNTENFDYSYEAATGNVLDVSWSVTSGKVSVVTDTKNLEYPIPQPQTTHGASASKAGDSEIATKKIKLSTSHTSQVVVTVNISERKK